jgi:hypothetical protein
MSETSEQRRQRFRELEESIADTLLQKYPKITFQRNNYGIEIFYYTVSFSRCRLFYPYFIDSSIKICKSEKRINTSIPNLDSFYLTEEAARKAIGEHIPAAEAKFQECLTALNQLKKDMNFNMSYTLEGDTHGIDSTYPYISFEMGGFEFTFEIED